MERERLAGREDEGGLRGRVGGAPDVAEAGVGDRLCGRYQARVRVGYGGWGAGGCWGGLAFGWLRFGWWLEFYWWL